MREKSLTIINILQKFIANYDASNDQTFLAKVVPSSDATTFKNILSFSISSSDSSLSQFNENLNQIYFPDLISNLDQILNKEVDLEKYYDVALAFVYWVFVLIENKFVKTLQDRDYGYLVNLNTKLTDVLIQNIKNDLDLVNKISRNHQKTETISDVKSSITQRNLSIFDLTLLTWEEKFTCSSEKLSSESIRLLNDDSFLIKSSRFYLDLLICISDKDYYKKIFKVLKILVLNSQEKLETETKIITGVLSKVFKEYFENYQNLMNANKISGESLMQSLLTLFFEMFLIKYYTSNTNKNGINYKENLFTREIGVSKSLLGLFFETLFDEKYTSIIEIVYNNKKYNMIIEVFSKILLNGKDENMRRLAYIHYIDFVYCYANLLVNLFQIDSSQISKLLNIFISQITIICKADKFDANDILNVSEKNDNICLVCQEMFHQNMNSQGNDSYTQKKQQEMFCGLCVNIFGKKDGMPTNLNKKIAVSKNVNKLKTKESKSKDFMQDGSDFINRLSITPMKLEQKESTLNEKNISYPTEPECSLILENLAKIQLTEFFIGDPYNSGNLLQKIITINGNEDYISGLKNTTEKINYFYMLVFQSSIKDKIKAQFNNLCKIILYFTSIDQYTDKQKMWDCLVNISFFNQPFLMSDVLFRAVSNGQEQANSSIRIRCIYFISVLYRSIFLIDFNCEKMISTENKNKNMFTANKSTYKQENLGLNRFTTNKKVSVMQTFKDSKNNIDKKEVDVLNNMQALIALENFQTQRATESNPYIRYNTIYNISEIIDLISKYPSKNSNRSLKSLLEICLLSQSDNDQDVSTLAKQVFIAYFCTRPVHKIYFFVNKQSFDESKRKKEVDFNSCENVYSKFIEKLIGFRNLLLPNDISKHIFLDSIVQELFDLQATDFCCGLMFYLIENICKYKGTDNEFLVLYFLRLVVKKCTNCKIS